MKRISLLLFVIVASTLYAEKLEITADRFFAKDINREVKFIGNAQIVQGATRIHASKISIYFNEDNSTRQYKALGEVRFHIQKIKAKYQGSCRELVYLPQMKTYILEGNVKVKDQQNQRDIVANRVEIQSRTGAFVIEGGKKHAARLTFDMK